MKTIAVVGAGFSGTLLSLHLLRQCPPPTRLVLIERNSQFGRGLAYGTPNDSHILNVPAARMSAFHDRPNDFLDWLARQAAAEHDGPPPGPQTFAPRRLFGAYVRALLNDEIKRSGRDRLELVKGDVISLDGSPQRLVLTLDRGRTIEADMAVLAIGNFPPEPVPIANPGFYDTDFYRPDPWAADVLTGLDPDSAILLLGTGLTTMDLVISLLDQQHRGPIYALSRRGLLPRRHAGVPLPAPEHAPYPTAVTALTRFLRREAARATAQGSGWQPVIDELRPFTVDVWQAMPLPDRQRFLRHLRPWWDVHRHRMAAGVADRIDAARAGGQLRILVGRVRDLAAGDRPVGNGPVGDGAVTVQYRPRRQDGMAAIRDARVVNCAGPGADYDRIQEPLIRHLLRDGLVRPDPLRLGLDVTGNCALLNAQGAISRRLFAVGPMTKGTFWEMTAVPDIRRQTEKLAEYLAGLIKAAPPRPAT
jgi:uncharacterized NAD(P)/FAD-binding protein YdhS